MLYRDVRAALRLSLVVLAGLGALLSLVSFCGGCAAVQRPALPPQTALERTVAQAGLAAWREAGMPVTPAVRELARLRIERPDQATFERTCPQGRRPAACLRWQDWDVPVAVLAPWLSTELLVAHAALHEWIHGAVYRSGLRPDYDGLHENPLIWSGHGPGSVESIAQRLIDGRLQQ